MIEKSQPKPRLAMRLKYEEVLEALRGRAEESSLIGPEFTIGAVLSFIAKEEEDLRNWAGRSRAVLELWKGCGVNCLSLDLKQIMKIKYLSSKRFQELILLLHIIFVK